MSLLSIAQRLLNLAKPPPPQTHAPEAATESTEPSTAGPTEQESFKSPQQLAVWVRKLIIAGRPLDEDYQLLPDAEARTDLEISVEQRERCLREYSVLRLAGVSLFVKQTYSDEFWLVFNQHSFRYLVDHVTSTGQSIDEPAMREALESYVLAGTEADVDRIHAIYLTRLYDDNPNYLRMKLSGIGGIASNFILETHEIFRNAYCQVTQGMPYDAFVQFSNAIAKVKAGEA